MRKVIFLTLILALVMSSPVFASTNKPLDNLGKGLDDMLYAKVEVPDNINETNSKGMPVTPECTDMTKDDVGRGIARFVKGVWEVATFWYPEEN